MFRRYDALHTSDGGRLGRFERTARALEELHFPYDAIVFGHPEIWDDAKAFERIKRQYKVIILPGVDAVTDAQLDLLKTCQQNGARIIIDHGFASYDENLNQREKVDVAALRPVQPVTKETIVQAAPNATLVRMEAPTSVTVNVWRSCRGESLDVHLLNYDVSIGDEKVNPVRGIKLTVALPDDLKVDQCLLARPGQPATKLDMTRQRAAATVVVPRIDAYGIASFTAKGVLDSAQRQAEARRGADRAKVRRMASRYNLY